MSYLRFLNDIHFAYSLPVDTADHFQLLKTIFESEAGEMAGELREQSSHAEDLSLGSQHTHQMSHNSEEIMPYSELCRHL